MIIYIAEVIGTFTFVLFSLMIISNAIKEKKYGEKILLTTSIGVGTAYIIPCIVFGEISGGHFNPVITLATTYIGIFEEKFAIGYMICQIFGALLANIIFLIINKNIVLNFWFNNYENSNIEKNENNFIILLLKEIIATFFLLFSLLGVTFVLNANDIGNIYILYFIVMIGIGLAFDYKIVSTNPFRDLFFKTYTFVFLPKEKKKICFAHVVANIIGPIIGSILAAKLYDILPWGNYLK